MKNLMNYVRRLLASIFRRAPRPEEEPVTLRIVAVKQLPPMRKWTIGITYDATNDAGQKIRVKSAFQTEATDIPRAYQNAELLSATLPGLKLGAIMPGWHMLVP